MPVSSKSLPSLPNKKDKTNWVEKAGGLPDFIERVAKHIQASNPGYSTSRVIASAVSQVKKMAAKGNEKAVAAVAQWEAMKAKTKADLSVGPLPGEPATERLVLAHGEVLTTSDAEYIESLDTEGEAMDLTTEIDIDRYELALSAARAERGLPPGGLNLAAIRFDPQKHPRDYKGKFREALDALPEGGHAKLPDGTQVRKLGGNFRVAESSGSPLAPSKRVSEDKTARDDFGPHRFATKDAADAAETALKHSKSAGKRDELPDSLESGGGKIDGVPDDADRVQSARGGRASFKVGEDVTDGVGGLAKHGKLAAIWRSKHQGGQWIGAVRLEDGKTINKPLNEIKKRTAEGASDSGGKITVPGASAHPDNPYNPRFPLEDVPERDVTKVAGWASGKQQAYHSAREEGYDHKQAMKIAGSESLSKTGREGVGAPKYKAVKKK